MRHAWVAWLFAPVQLCNADVERFVLIGPLVEKVFPCRAKDAQRLVTRQMGVGAQVHQRQHGFAARHFLPTQKMPHHAPTISIRTV